MTGNVCVTRAAEPRTHSMDLVRKAGLAGQCRVALLAVGLGALSSAHGILLAGCRLCAPLVFTQTGLWFVEHLGEEQKPYETLP